MKFIIWRHKLHESTHGYIHSAYYKSLKFLGYETYWLDSNDNLQSIDFSNSIFFLEGSHSQDIPIVSNCKYITHHKETDELVSKGIPYENILQLGNYLPSKEIYEKVDDLCYWDKNTRTLYQCWATDLLPSEINDDNFISFDNSRKKLNYIGMFCDKELWWWAEEFSTIISNNHGVEFKLFTQSVSHEENMKLIQQSFLCPDFRNDWHLQCGYIPCRIWKNISYGRIVGTNSPYIKRSLGDYVVYGGTPHTLYENLLDAEKNKKINMKDAMKFVKTNHTYINRIQNILKFL